VRRVLAALLTLASAGVLAAPPDRTVRIGVIASGPTDRWSLIETAVRSGLRDKGYVEGRNLVLPERYVLR
jgi:hypothetical protein